MTGHNGWDRKAYTYLGAVIIVGAFVGAVTTWAATRANETEPDASKPSPSTPWWF